MSLTNLFETKGKLTMKKVLATIMALTLALSMAACSGGNTSSTSGTSSTTSTSSTAEESTSSTSSVASETSEVSTSSVAE